MITGCLLILAFVLAVVLTLVWGAVRIIRVFPRKTRATPRDELAAIDREPGFFDEADEVLSMRGMRHDPRLGAVAHLDAAHPAQRRGNRQWSAVTDEALGTADLITALIAVLDSPNLWRAKIRIARSKPKRRRSNAGGGIFRLPLLLGARHHAAVCLECGKAPRQEVQKHMEYAATLVFGPQGGHA